MQFTQGQLVKKFTPLGFEVVDIPPNVYSKLINAVSYGITHLQEVPQEEGVDGIYGPVPPKFIDIGPLAWEVLRDLKELHEEWSGMALTGTSSYGVRLYLNGSSLVMHNDKVFISC